MLLFLKTSKFMLVWPRRWSYLLLVFVLLCGTLLVPWDTTWDSVLPGAKVIQKDKLCHWPSSMDPPSCANLLVASRGGSPCLLGQWSVIDANGAVQGTLEVQYRKDSGMPNVYMIALFNEHVGYVSSPLMDALQTASAQSDRGSPAWYVDVLWPFGVYKGIITEDQNFVVFPGHARWVKGAIPCFMGNWKVLDPHNVEVGSLSFAVNPNQYWLNVTYLSHTGMLRLLVIDAPSLQWGIEVHWPQSSPWFGIYGGKISSDSRRVIFADHAAWIRKDGLLHNGLTLEENAVQTVNLQIECAVEYLETNPGHLGPEGCIACNCSSTPEGRPPAHEAMVRNNYMSVLALVLLAMFVIPLVGNGRSVNWRSGCLEEVEHMGEEAKADFLPALHSVRFLGAVHIIRFHYWFRERGSEWGFSWVSWYFMVSGFVLTRSRPSFGDKFSWHKYGKWLLARCASTWPLHAFVLMAVEHRYGLGAGKWDLHVTCPVALGVPQTVLGLFLSNVFFFNSWTSCGDRGPWNHVNWFLATLFAYWLAFPFLLYVICHFQSRRHMYCMMALCWLWSTLGHVMFQYYSLNPHNNLDGEGVVNAQIRYTHPTAHFHVFLSGMVLAKLHAMELKMLPHPTWRQFCSPITQAFLKVLGRNRCTLSACTLLVLFHFYTPWRFYLFWWNGGLMPVHAFLILGLSSRDDFLTRILGHRLFSKIGSWAYALYITQVLAVWLKDDVGQLLGISVEQFEYAPLLSFAICTVVGHYGVERPGIRLHRFLSQRLTRCVNSVE